MKQSNLKSILEAKLGKISPEIYRAAMDTCAADIQTCLNHDVFPKNERVLQLLSNNVEFFRKLFGERG